MKAWLDSKAQSENSKHQHPTTNNGRDAKIAEKRREEITQRFLAHRGASQTAEAEKQLNHRDAIDAEEFRRSLRTIGTIAAQSAEPQPIIAEKQRAAEKRRERHEFHEFSLILTRRKRWSLKIRLLQCREISSETEKNLAIALQILQRLPLIGSL